MLHQNQFTENGPWTVLFLESYSLNPYLLSRSGLFVMVQKPGSMLTITLWGQPLTGLAHEDVPIPWSLLWQRPARGCFKSTSYSSRSSVASATCFAIYAKIHVVEARLTFDSSKNKFQANRA